jgi:hypothetical protein
MILYRSFKDCSSELKYESRLIILERLVNRGLLKNSRQLMLNYICPSIPWIFRVICSMNNLEKLSLLKWEPKLTEDIPQLFRSCPKLTQLHMRLFESQNLEMNEELKNELRLDFQRLKIFELSWGMNSWPVIQEMLT